MSAPSQYITSVLFAFQAFLHQQETGDNTRAQENATLLLLSYLEYKTDLNSWSIDEFEHFLESPPEAQNFSSYPKQLVSQFVRKYPPYQTSVLLHHFTLALKADQCSYSTLKNYRSDINQFLHFARETEVLRALSKPKIVAFLRSQRQKGLKRSTANRKLVSLTQFAIWLEKSGYLEGVSSWLNELGSRLAELSDQWDLPEGSTEASSTLDQADYQDERQWTLPLPTSPQLSTTDRSSITESVAGVAGLANAAIAEPAATQSTPVATAQHRQEFRSRLKQHLTALSRRVKNENGNKPFLPYLNLAVMVLFLLGVGVFGYQQFIRDTVSPFAYPSTLTRPNRTLSFQGRLTDTNRNPITGETDMRFKLYDSGPGIGSGNILWDSGTCTVDPDQDGIFSTGLGDECGDEITDDVFTENSNVWLQVEIDNGVTYEVLEPRQSIKTVPYALNSETLQGFPASMSATENTVVVMNADGDIELGSLNPDLRSTNGTFTIEAQSLVLQTVSGSNGDIVLAPDGTGQVGVLSNLFMSGYLSAPGATLSATYAGGIPLVVNGVSGQTANLTEWHDGDGNVTVVDEDGRIGIGTSNPSYGLDVNGDARISTLGGGATDTVVTHASGVLQSRSIDSRVWGTSLVDGSSLTANFLTKVSDANTIINSIVFDDGTNVGIGTTAPSYKLDVSGDINLSGALRIGGDAGTDGYLLTSSAGGANTWTDPSDVANLYSHWADALGAIYTKNTTLDFLLGGTATSSAKFSVANINSGMPTLTLSDGIDSTYLTADGILGTGTGQSLYLSPAGTPQMTITDAGDVGIGTTAPDYTLDVNGDARISTLGSGSTDTVVTHDSGVLQSRSIDSRVWGTSLVDGSSLTANFLTKVSDANTIINSLVFDDGTNVGIGTTNPSSMFSVGSTSQFQVNSSGAIAAATGITSSGNITFSGLTPDRFVRTTTGGLLTTAQYIDLETEVTGVLGITNGGTNASTIGSAGSVAYSTGTAYAFSAVGNVDECLLSAGSGAPTWGSCAGAVSGSIPWAVSAGVVYTKNTTVDLLLGSNATASAKFSVTNIDSGVPTTTVSDGAGNGTYFSADGIIGTTGSQNLYFSPSGTARMTIADSGNVGIGTTNPSALFSIGSSSQFQVNSSGAIAAATGITSSGTITFSSLTADRFVKTTTGGQLITSQFIDLTSEITGILPIANGGTNASTIGSAGSIAYSTGTAYAFSAVGSAGECLLSAGTGAPTWGTCAGADESSILWDIEEGAIFAKNPSVDLLLGGNATASAKFAVLNMNSGIPTISLAGGSGNTFLTAGGILGTSNAQNLFFAPDGTTKMTLTSSGLLGLGTTSPDQQLHVVGHCVTGDTLLLVRRRKRKKNGEKGEDEDLTETELNNDDSWEEVLLPITQVIPGDEVLSLNEKSGEMEFAKVNGLKDMGIREVYEILTKSGKTIRTTAEHPYLTTLEEQYAA